MAAERRGEGNDKPDRAASMNSRRFRADPPAVAAARHFVEAALTGTDASLRERAVLMVSELATNVVRHARGEFTVEIEVRPDGTYLAVHDASSVRPTPRTPEPTDASGRGLQIVDALADEWGVDATADGKVVWCRLPPAERPASSCTRR